MWRVAQASGGTVILRIEDHDRQRCRPEFEVALLDDLEELGFVPGEPLMAALRTGAPSSYRQQDNGAVYAATAAELDSRDLVYACDCSRSTFAAWTAARGQPWSGPGCPGGCAGRGLARDAADVAWRVMLGDGIESWADLALGSQSGMPSRTGDLAIRDRRGNWTYGFCVVVDDMRHGIDLVIRGEDLLEATPAQIRLGRLLGRAVPPRFLHHPLVRRPDGRKLSKADGATGVRDMIRAGYTAGDLLERASSAIALPPGYAHPMYGSTDRGHRSI